MTKNILIIHYNTPTLTECLVRSINRFVEDAKVYIFDNSTVRPFTAEFENVTLLDNTKGQIIDFNKWLNRYPNRSKSNGKTNEWGSAKHCYSVEKCMEIIGEPFVLLDSDVLLKRDISDLFDENYIYIGEVTTQPSSSIKRTLPFICYINVTMCNKKNVHYFDDNYMHGLYKTPTSDKYDTGAGFYLSASKFNYKKIRCNDYIVHYGHGSWNKPGVKYALNPKEWLLYNKKYWTNDMNKKVIYTCITGGYDTLREPVNISEGFDYICFTDDPNIKSNVWEIRPIPESLKGLSNVKKQRYIKINTHLFLKEYDLSIWVDGNVLVKGNMNDFIDKCINKDNVSVYVPKHPSRNCIYREAIAVVSMRKDTKEIVEKQIEKYKSESFPKDYGLLQSNILVRYHNKQDCIKLMETWSNEVVNGSHRDQLSFNFSCWKNNEVKVVYLDKNICKSEWFTWQSFHSKITKPLNKEITKTISSKKLKGKERFNNFISKKRMINSARYRHFNSY